MTRPSGRYRVLSIIGAFVAWGAWSAWINVPYGLAAGLRAGFVQGVASALVTAFVIASVTWWFHLLPRSPLTFPLPAVLTIAVSGTVVTTAHWLAGTPEILATVWLPLLLGLVYALVTTWRLARGGLPHGSLRTRSTSGQQETQ